MMRVWGDSFKDDFYELYEHDLTQVGDSLRELCNQIIKDLKSLVQIEKEYWMVLNMNLFNYVNIFFYVSIINN